MSRSLLLVNQAWLAPELRELGHRICTAGVSSSVFDLNYPPFAEVDELLASLPDGFAPDAIVLFDDSSVLHLIGLETCSLPVLFVSVDTHHHHFWHRCLTTVAGTVLVAQQDYMPLFHDADSSINSSAVQWFPPGAPCFPESHQERTVPCSFCGTMSPESHPKRVEFFQQFAGLLPVEARSGDYIDLYSRSKIVINECIKGDLNFRVFEAMACGALLLTPHIGNGLLELFQEGEELVTYPDGDAGKAAELARYYLEHEPERALIAARGCAKVRANHTAKQRAKTLEEALLSTGVGPASLRKRNLAACYLASAMQLHFDRSEHVGIERNLVRAAECLGGAAVEERRADDEIVSSVLICQALLKCRNMNSELSAMNKQLAEACPNELLFVLGHVEDLLSAGDYERAELFARRFCGQGQEMEEFFASLPYVMERARGEVAGIYKRSDYGS